MAVAKHKRRRVWKKQYWHRVEVRQGSLPAKWAAPPPPPPPVHGPRDVTVPDPPDYDPTPERVAEDQRRAVREAKRALGRGATPEAISDRVCLAVSVVVRRLAELRSR